ncbi:MAG TPA: MBL fold metallo-hydrolase [Chitinophagaceae bacterium]|nr:MBL fold metallo-hydrolase [Chitinophagaceae bacterium]
MTIKIFQSGKGDCMLFSNGTTNILVDGGVSPAYNMHVAKELNKLRKSNTSLDLACVSHIDDDHIGGFLKMIEDEVDWRVYDYQQAQNNNRVKAPKSPRPPAIKEIWHNAFHEIVKDNKGAIESMLTASANILMASSNKTIQELGEITFSKAQAIQLSRRLKPEQLKIPQNAKAGGKFVMYRKGARPIKYGSFKITVLAPFSSDLTELRTEWNEWLEKSKRQLKGIKEKVDRDADALANATFPNIQYYEALAEELTPLILSQLATAKKMGVRTQVTAPNLASIMFLLEENGKTVLMTGDGHADDIIKGLENTGKLKKNKGLHVDVLKIQHHGANANMTLDFCNRITADYYVFCGNGEHSNPEKQVVQAIIDSRTTQPAITKEAKNKFTLIFNSSTAATIAKNKKHMTMLEKLVAGSAAKHKNVKFKFMPVESSYISLTV